MTGALRRHLVSRGFCRMARRNPFNRTGIAMAKDEAAEAEGAEGGEGKKSKKKLMIIAGAALVLVLGGGAAGYFLFFKSDKKDDHHAEVHEKPPVFVEVPDVMVNLSNGRGERVQYLKIKIVLELPELPMAEKIKPTMPRMMDTFQTYLRELRPSDLRGSAGLYRLREELTRRVNASIEPSSVKAVLFKEVMIQ